MSKKKEYSTWEWVVVGIFAAIWIGFDIYLFTAKPCEGIDQVYVSCRFQLSSVLDWIGFLLVNGCAGILIYKTFNPSLAPDLKSNPLIWYWVGIAVGIGLITI